MSTTDTAGDSLIEIGRRLRDLLSVGDTLRVPSETDDDAPVRPSQAIMSLHRGVVAALLSGDTEREVAASLGFDASPGETGVLVVRRIAADALSVDAVKAELFWRIEVVAGMLEEVITTLPPVAVDVEQRLDQCIRVLTGGEAES
jgi:hypothetical protein